LWRRRLVRDSHGIGVAIRLATNTFLFDPVRATLQSGRRRAEPRAKIFEHVAPVAAR
jgi:hypothetical protein